jgi:Toprim-like/CHC2 zinc finger
MKSSYKEQIEDLKARDIVAFLSEIGCKSVRTRGRSQWFLSPFRQEKTASFKVDSYLNRWYDFGTREGGDLIDLIMRINSCSLKELLSGEISFQSIPPHHVRNQPSEEKAHKLEIITVSSLCSPVLSNYLSTRAINIEIASQFCDLVRYKIGLKNYFSIGFKNDLGGYELRSPISKCSSSPKGVTTFLNGTPVLCVFEGFLDFLSYLSFYGMTAFNTSDFLILNSIAFAPGHQDFMNSYEQVRLYLDRDDAGQNCRRKLLQIHNRYIDKSSLYKSHKDFNEWLINVKTTHPP